MDFDHFLFALPGATLNTSNARKVHIRRLNDILQLCLQRNDAIRSRRAWAILARCKEVSWMEMWTTAVHILSDVNQDHSSSKQLEFLRAMMLQFPDARVSILRELVLRLISSEKYRDALDELELYLPSFPYQDDPLLHLYAGLTALYLAHSPPTPEPQNSKSHIARRELDHLECAIAQNQFDTTLFRYAQTNFERANCLDPDSAIAQAFLEKMTKFNHESKWSQMEGHDSDDDNIDVDDIAKKRIRYHVP